MDYKWIGAILIVTGCAGFGLSLSAAHRREENCLRSLMAALDYMVCELHFRAPALPELCRGAAKISGRGVGQVFSALAAELETSSAADVGHCMNIALENGDLPPKARDQLQILGTSLGRFDMEGQMKSLESVRASCRRTLDSLTADRDSRLRNYQTLSLCTGAALAILLI